MTQTMRWAVSGITHANDSKQHADYSELHAAGNFANFGM